MIKKLFFVFCFIPVLASAQQKISIIPSVGYAWRTAKLSDQLDAGKKAYGKQLMSGMNYDISAYYRLNETMGLGIKYNLYTASASGIGYEINNPDNQISLATNDKISFIGPAFLYSNFEQETRHKLLYDVGVGLVNYISKTNTAEVKGSNVGLAASISYMYAVSPRIYIGPHFGLGAGVLKKIKVNEVERTLSEGEYEGLHKISAGVGLTFRL